MLTPVSSSIPAVNVDQPTPTNSAPEAKGHHHGHHKSLPPSTDPFANPTDTVQLSGQAKSTANKPAGDVDHDGDRR